jgi:hypothetical protein
MLINFRELEMDEAQLSIGKHPTGTDAHSSLHNSVFEMLTPGEVAHVAEVLGTLERPVTLAEKRRARINAVEEVKRNDISGTYVMRR